MTDANSLRDGFWKSVAIDREMPRVFLRSKSTDWPTMEWPLSSDSQYSPSRLGIDLTQYRRICHQDRSYRQIRLVYVAPIALQHIVASL